MIELRNIRKRFGKVQALNGVSLDIRPGSIHGIVGENGAGKSTLMQILTGYIRKTDGRVVLDGREVNLRTPREARRLGIGMLYQEPLDFPQLTVLENYMAGSALPRAGALASLRELSGRFGFSLDPAATADSLTVGQRQQLELLRLIREGVRLLILDEPTTGISETQQELLFHALAELRASGTAIVLVSHKLEEVERLCDTVSVLRQGLLAGSRKAPFDRNDLLHLMFQFLPEKERGQTAAPKGAPVLQLQGVRSSQGRSGLAATTLSIRGGEIVGLAGLDGSGQQVFLKLGAGLLEPEAGHIKRSGGRTVFLPADRLAEGLISGLSIREHHLLAQVTPFFLSPGSGRQQADGAIQQFSIKGTAETPADGLSGGNQQRLLLSLIPADGKLLFIENPTRGLDVHSANWTWQQLRSRLCPESAICFASPDLEEIMEHASRILVFFDGRIILDTPAETTDYHTLSQAITGTSSLSPAH